MAQCEAGSKPVCGDVSHWMAMPKCKAAVVLPVSGDASHYQLAQGRSDLGVQTRTPDGAGRDHETSCADRQLVPLAVARAFASRPA